MLNLKVRGMMLLPHAKTGENCDWVISISEASGGKKPYSLPEGIRPERHKQFFFDDLRSPIEVRPSNWEAGAIRAIPPTKADVAAIIEFARAIPDGSNVMIHCHAGVSRSSASAFAIHCSRGIQPEVAFELMLKNAHAVWPNELIVRYADELLQMDGRMSMILASWMALEKKKHGYVGVEGWV